MINNHIRSFSEQPQQQQHQQVNNALEAQTDSFELHHSDSQQSLDQLFNPSIVSTNPKPLRDRNLPRSFFNPSLKEDEAVTNNESSGAGVANFHARSVSYDHCGGVVNSVRSNLHARTQSIIVPMPRLLSNQASHQSSHEVLDTQHTSVAQANGASHTYVNSSNGHQHQDHNHPQHTNQHHQTNITSDCWPSNSSMNNAVSSWTSGVQAQQQVPNQTVESQPMQQTFTQGSNHQSQQHVRPNNNYHIRSMSFDPSTTETHSELHNNLHSRTMTSVAPIHGTMSTLMSGMTVTSHPSSEQSSHEFLNQTCNTNPGGPERWSSSGYITDDMAPTNGWTSTNMHDSSNMTNIRPMIAYSQRVNHQPVSYQTHHQNQHAPIQHIEPYNNHPVVPQQVYYDI